MKTIAATVCLSIGLAWVLSASGETVRYVALSGDGSDGLTWATARTNLQAAIDDAASLDVICVKTGTYVQSSALLISGKNLTLRGGYRGDTPEPGEAVGDPGLTVLDGNAAGRVLVVTNCTAGLIEGLTLRNGLMADHGGGVFMIYVTNAFRNCVIRDNAIYGSEKQGVGIYMTGMEVTFDRCVIRNNLNTSSNGTRYAGALATGAGNLLMRDTEIVGNNARYCGAMMLSAAGTATFSNCLVRNNWDAGTWGTIRSDKTKTVFNFCTVADNTSGGIYRNNGTVYVTNSIVWNNGDDLIGTASVLIPSYSCIEDPDAGAGVIHDNPRFILDYYLADGSPCLNAATVTAASAGVDNRYAGTNAMDGGLADLGYHHVLPYTISTPDLYVDTAGGNDTNAGSSASAPLKTVTRALAIAESGARIHVAAGTYSQANGESFPLAFKADPVELLGTNAGLTVIDATNSGTRAMNLYNMGAGTLISNLTFTGGSNVFGAGMYLRGTSARLTDCVIRNNRLNKAEQRGGGMYVEQGCPIFYGCQIVSNRHTSGSTFYGGGGELTGRPRFERCVLFANSCTWQGGAFVFGGESLEMVNCLVASNDTTADTYVNADGIHVNAGAVQLRQMTFAGNLGKGLVRSAGTVTASNSIFWGNGIDTTGAVSLAYCSVSNGVFTDLGGCTNLAPAFMDPVYCHLQSRKGQYRGGYFSGGQWESGTANSPLIDRGDPVSPYALEPAPNGKRVNLGAYGNTPVASRSPAFSGVIVLVK